MAMSFGRFSHGMSGWRRMVPVAVHGASRRTASKGRGGDQVSTSAATSSAASLKPGEVDGKAFQARGGNVDRGHLARRQGERAVLPPGAAQRSATRLPATSPRRRAGTAAAAFWTHHSPSRVAGKLPRSARTGSAAPFRWEHDAAEPLRPALRIALDRQVEARLDQMRRGDLAGRRLAIGRGPPLPEPVRRVDALGVVGGEKGVALAREAAEHPIDQRLEMAGMAVRLGIGHGGRHRGVGRHVEKQNLRRAGSRIEPSRPERGGSPVPSGDAARRGSGRAGGARRDDRAGERPVARRQLPERRIAGLRIEQRVERRAVENALREARDARAARRDRARVGLPARSRAGLPSTPRALRPAADIAPRSDMELGERALDVGRGAEGAAGTAPSRALQCGDAVGGRRMGGEQAAHAPAGERIDDEQVGHGRIAFGIDVGRPLRRRSSLPSAEISQPAGR